MNLKSLNNFSLEHPKVLETLKFIEGAQAKVNWSGIVGSSKSIYAAACASQCPGHHVFILDNKEDAAYFLNDFTLNYTIDKLSFAKSLVLQGLVNNIFDVKYISNGYFFTYDDDFSTPGSITTIEGAGFYPQAGINFLVGATLTF